MTDALCLCNVFAGSATTEAFAVMAAGELFFGSISRCE
jgi:hypothetical protein